MTMLDSQHVQVLLIDMQEHALKLGRTQQTVEFRKSTAVLGRVAGLLNIPSTQSILQTVETPDVSSISEVVATMGAAAFIRCGPHPLADEPTFRALAGNERDVLAVGGLVTEVGVYNAVHGALDAGYRVHVLVDLCGGLTERSEQATLLQMQHGGAVLSSVPTFTASMLRDFTIPLDRAALDEIYTLT